VLAVATTLAVTPLLQIVIKASGPAPEIASEFDAFPGEPEVLPDIYFLLLDAYGNSNVLSNIYGFDNEPFLTDLERRGFDVSRSATADYTYTHASIPSMLNMEYLTGTDLSENAQSLDRLISAVAGDNRVVTWLKDLGYTYIHGETFDGTNDCGPNVDICLPSPSWDHTVEYLLGRTPVWPLLFPVHGSPATAFNAVRIEQMSQWEEWESPLNDLSDACLSSDEQDPLGKLRQLLVKMLIKVERDHSFCLVMIMFMRECSGLALGGASESVSRFIQNQHERRVVMIKNAVQRGQLPESLDLEFASAFIKAVVDGFVSSWLQRAEFYSLSDNAEPFVDTLIASLQSLKGLPCNLDHGVEKL
jgi:TetR/AcrR family acrAB operon transcriptional repressor